MGQAARAAKVDYLKNYNFFGGGGGGKGRRNLISIILKRGLTNIFGIKEC